MIPSYGPENGAPSSQDPKKSESQSPEAEYVQDELELETDEETKQRLFSGFENRKFKTRDYYGNALEQISLLALNEAKHKPTSSDREIIVKAIVELFPEKKDRELLAMALKDEQERLDAEMETPEMRRIESTGQEGRYPEYQNLLREIRKLGEAIIFLRDLEGWIEEAKKSAEIRTDEIFDKFRAEQKNYFINHKLYRGTLAQALAEMGRDIHYSQRGTGEMTDRDERSQDRLREEYAHEILEKFSKEDINLLRQRLAQEPGYAEHLKILNEIFG